MFQNSVINNIKQDESLIAIRWASFQNFLSKVEAIREFKEEEYQDGFLLDVFQESLGYTLKSTNPSDYTLSREAKNETDAKKSDGAIWVDNKVVGVIELKAQGTKSLDKKPSKTSLSPIDQAFGYLVSNSDAHYVIVSNFNELRLYIDKKTEYQKFNLFTLSYDDFRKLHILLSYESIKAHIPIKLKEESNRFEATISKQLYKDFSQFRLNLFDNLILNNIDKESTLLLRLTQKLCDRIIFILFAEDRGLLNANSIKEIRDEFHNQKFTNYTLYDMYKIYFKAINEGNPKLQIAKYNGGLFATDEVLDSLKIDDTILDEEVQTLSNYDFASEVSVNILGHIFEQSLTDLEELQASLDNEHIDKKQTKRKKDGVFYTPEYITKYIVENTLGKMCNDKREALKIIEITKPKNSKKPTKKEQLIKENLEAYRDWLLNIKILDPACGSGAFLNQALDYLITEHEQIQNDLVTMGDITAYYEIEKSILENNLYGVDINEDATEIAKLSLWLKTAQKGRVLTKLADKIVVANSLLDMPFKEGSFDIVIGNPPYVRLQSIKNNYEDEAKLYEEKYLSATGNYDMYALFMEMSYKMLKRDGELSYILPHKFLISDFGSGIRGFLADNKAVKSILHFGSEMVFDDASTYTCIINLSHNNKELKFKSINPKDIFDTIEFDTISYDKLSNAKWNLSNQGITKVFAKIDKQPLKVKDVFSKIFQGIKTSADTIYLLLKVKNGLYSKQLNQIIKVEDGLLKPILKGENIHRYKNLSNQYFVIFPYLIKDGKALPMSEEYIKDNFPNGYKYLQANEEFLRGREKGRFDNPNEWFLFSRKQGIDYINQTRIISAETSYKAQMTLDDKHFYHSGTIYSFVLNNNYKSDYRFFLSLLNSNLMWFFIKNTSSELRGGYFKFTTKYLEKFPLPKLKNLDDQKPFIQKANQMLELNKQFQEVKNRFLDMLELEKIPKKIQNFYQLSFDEFIKEYTKAKKIKFVDKLEERNFKYIWKSLFEADTKEALTLQTQINTTDKEIDTMVYKLYGLSDEEVEIVEG
ncbi:MAG: N-6 DNA methylase [Sulfurovum sp.]